MVSTKAPSYHADMGRDSGILRAGFPFVLSFAIYAVGGLAPAALRADGVYGRFDGDLTASLEAGGGARVSAGEAQGAVTAAFRLRYLDAVGPVLIGEWTPNDGARLVVGLELRPLFPALLFSGLSTGSEWLDLWIASFGVEMGMALDDDGGNLGLGLAVGVACELPLLLPSHSAASGFGPGVNLRLFARHRSAPSGAVAGPAAAASDWVLAAALVFRWSMHSGLVSLEPPRYRNE